MIPLFRTTHLSVTGIAALMEKHGKDVVSRTDTAKTFEVGTEFAQQVGRSERTHKDGKVVKMW